MSGVTALASAPLGPAPPARRGPLGSQYIVGRVHSAYLNLPAWRGGLAFDSLSTEMDDWILQHAGPRPRVIHRAAGLLRWITDYWSLTTDHQPLVGIPAE